jgi:hopanoid biosynthesis associated RND transporter like protein HpnN
MRVSGAAASSLGRLLELAVARVVRVSRRLLVVAGAVVALCAWYTTGHLGMHTDTTAMFSDALSWRQIYLDYQRAFPRSVDTIDVVIEAATPDLADLSARRLATALDRQRDLVEYAERPGGGEFFERNGLLYLDLTELRTLIEELTRAQPFLGSLAADPTLEGVGALLEKALAHEVDDAGIGLVEILDDLSAAAAAAAGGRLEPVSWRRLAGAAGAAVTHRSYVIVKPRLDYGELLPAGPVMERIREIARESGLVPERGVRVRITGSNAMEHEELETVSAGAARSGVLALFTVLAVLWWGLRSWWLVAASLITLVAGLVVTAGYAAAVIGHLNVISVAFAVLYIGLGVDYAIHYCMRYRELLVEGLGREGALVRAAGDVGGSLALCALTTGAGFYAFVPTDFAGVSELGSISGTGMFVGLVASLTVLPALLALMPPPRTVAGAAGFRWLDAGVRTRPRTILRVAGLVAVVSALALPAVRFDGNPLNLRDPRSEAVATYRDLLASGTTSPWSLDVLAVDAASARSLRARLESVSEVESVRSVSDLVPGQQGQKLELVGELDLLYGGSLGVSPAAGSEGAEVMRTAVERLESVARASASDDASEPTARSAAALAVALQRLLAVSPGSGALELFRDAVVGTLPAEIERLDAALGAEPVSLDSLPAALREAWIAADDRRRLEIRPVADLDDREARTRFLAAVRDVAPLATGTPLVMEASGRAVVQAFQQAILTALALIVLLLALLLRRPVMVAQVLAPLLLAALVTVAAMVVLGVAFNYANVIALPLLLGVGVDSGIHLVHRTRSAPPGHGEVLATSTSRAVLVSALTTICSFGNLVISPHPGTASMGLVLSVGMLAALGAALVVLPAMLACWSPASAPGR